MNNDKLRSDYSQTKMDSVEVRVKAFPILNLLKYKVREPWDGSLKHNTAVMGRPCMYLPNHAAVHVFAQSMHQFKSSHKVGLCIAVPST